MLDHLENSQYNIGRKINTRIMAIKGTKGKKKKEMKVKEIKGTLGSTSFNSPLFYLNNFPMQKETNPSPVIQILKKTTLIQTPNI